MLTTESAISSYVYGGHVTRGLLLFKLKVYNPKLFHHRCNCCLNKIKLAWRYYNYTYIIIIIIVWITIYLWMHCSITTYIAKWNCTYEKCMLGQLKLGPKKLFNIIIKSSITHTFVQWKQVEPGLVSPGSTWSLTTVHMHCKQGVILY